MKDLTTISSDLFNKIRSRFSEIKIGDEQGALTTDPAQARFFDVNFKDGGRELGRVNIKVDEKAITVIYSNSMMEGQADSVKENWFSFLKDVRQFARKNMLNFDTRDITKSNLEKRDYEYLSQKNTGEPKMSESKLFGTSKTSYQDMGEAKIIVKHSAPVNYDNPAGRTQRIESIYIESATGERFRYPHRHLNGARAMARHVANGGTAYDTIGSYISSLSEELGKLRQFKNYTQRSGIMSEALGDINERVCERIDLIKSEISQLQKQNYYSEFKESFQPSEQAEVPSDVVQTWVDALTIKTFNEELTSVFPYLYRLVKEKQDQGLTYDDLVNEGGEACPDCNKEPCECDSVEETADMFAEFEQTVGELAKPGFDLEVQEEPNEGNEFAQKVQALKAKGAKPGTKFTTSDGEEHTLKDAIEMAGMQLEDFWTTEELAEMNQEQPVVSREVVEFIASMYDRETGTFPRGEEGVKIAVEKKFGEQAGQFANYVVEKLSIKDQVEDSVQCEQPDMNELNRIRSLAGM